MGNSPFGGEPLSVGVCDLDQLVALRPALPPGLSPGREMKSGQNGDLSDLRPLQTVLIE